MTELSLYILDGNTDTPLEGVYVKLTQNGTTIETIPTSSDGFLGVNTYHGLKAGKLNISIEHEGFEPYSEQYTVQPGYSEHTIRLGVKSMDFKLVYTEDLYAQISLYMPKNVAYVRTSIGNTYNPDDYTEYNNQRYGYDYEQYNITYTDLTPETTYQITATAFDEAGNILNQKTVEFTSKALYNICSAKAAVTDFVSFYNGISMELDKGYNAYQVIYESDKVPDNEQQIYKDAINNGLQNNTKTIYATNLKPNTKYTYFVVATESQYINDDIRYSLLPGKLVSMEIETISEYRTPQNRNIFIQEYENTKDLCNCKIYYDDDYLRGYKGVTVRNYDQFENEPDIVWVTLCKEQSYTSFRDNALYTIYYQDLTSWNGLVVLPSSFYATDHVGMLLKAKFKFGFFTSFRNGEQVTRSTVSPTIGYGNISDELKHNIGL